MPLERCGSDGKGWRYGKSGKCYTGKDAKKKAIRQFLGMKYNGYKGDLTSKAFLDESRQEIIAEGFSEAEAEMILSQVIRGEIGDKG